jgi:phosphoenolpyruvate synthase/pyruvate phosphate dikinase
VETLPFVKWLHRGPLSRAEVGGKAASLSEMLAWGFPVPIGFAITADAYRYFASEAGIGVGGLVSGTASGRATDEPDAVAALRVGETRLPGRLEDEIATAYEELVSLSGLACAVRSSAVSEDSAGASFAGLYESYLNVHGAREVMDAVRRCYASLWSERAVGYRRRQGMGDEAMGVVVMGLVPSDAAGIAFTAHPVTGDRNLVVINASWGLGESVVSGRVTPDAFVIEKRSLVLRERDIFEKEVAIYAHPDGSGTIEKVLMPERARTPSISDEEARAIAVLSCEIEARHGRPQDVEWGIHDGRIFLLQARPITTI